MANVSDEWGSAPTATIGLTEQEKEDLRRRMLAFQASQPVAVPKAVVPNQLPNPWPTLPGVQPPQPTMPWTDRTASSVPSPLLGAVSRFNETVKPEPIARVIEPIAQKAMRGLDVATGGQFGKESFKKFGDPEQIKNQQLTEQLGEEYDRYIRSNNINERDPSTQARRTAIANAFTEKYKKMGWKPSSEIEATAEERYNKLGFGQQAMYRLPADIMMAIAAPAVPALAKAANMPERVQQIARGVEQVYGITSSERGSVGKAAKPKWVEVNIPVNFRGREEQWMAEQIEGINYRRTYAPGKGTVVEQLEATPKRTRSSPGKMTEAGTARGITGNKGIAAAIQEAADHISTVSRAEELDSTIRTLEQTLGNRSLPYNGGAKAGPYQGYTTNQLNAMLDMYTANRNVLAEMATELPTTGSVQTGLPGVGPTAAQTNMLGEFGTATGAGGVKQPLINAAQIKAQQAARPLSGQTTFAKPIEEAAQLSQEQVIQGLKDKESFGTLDRLQHGKITLEQAQGELLGTMKPDIGDIGSLPNPADFAAQMKGEGVDRQVSWSRWVQRTMLNPGMDAKDWYKTYDSVTPARPTVKAAQGVPTPKPIEPASLTPGGSGVPPSKPSAGVPPAGGGGIPPVEPPKVPAPEPAPRAGKPVDAIKKLQTSLEDEYNLQKEVRSAEKGRRVAVAEGLIDPTDPNAMKVSTGALAGKMPIQSAGIKNPLTDVEWDDIRLQVIQSKGEGIKYFTRLNASEYVDALQLHLMDPVNNPVPPPSLAEAFKQVFPDVDIDSLVRSAEVPFDPAWYDLNIAPLDGPAVGKQLSMLPPTMRQQFKSLLGKVGSTFLDIGDLLRTVQATGDVSFTMRQGLVASIRNPVAGAKSFARGLKALGSTKYAEAFERIVRTDPDALRFLKDGGYMAPLDPSSVTRVMREESMVSKWTSKIPVIKASNRAFTIAANSLRLDVAKQGYRLLEKAGGTANDFTEFAKFVNVLTGRGNLPKNWQSSASVLNSLLFSPRLMMSRLQLPAKLASSSPFVRKEAAKSLAGLIGFTATVLGVSALMGGKVELDPRSAAFGKLRIGNTYYDITGGNVQYLRTIARLVTGKLKQPGGDVTDKSRLETVVQFIQSKESPLLSVITDLLAGSTYGGNKLEANWQTVAKELPKRLLPLSTQPVVSALIEEGWLGGEGWKAGLEGLKEAPAESLGVGAVTYASPPPSVIVDGPPELQTYVKNELTSLKMTVGRAGDTIGDLKLSPDDTLEYQRLTGELIGGAVAARMAQEDYAAMSADEKKTAIRSASDKARADAKAQFIMNSAITQPNPKDTPQVALVRQDLGRVGEYLSYLEPVTDDDARSTIGKVMRFYDPGLDVALALNGNNSGKVMEFSDKAQALLKERKAGGVTTLPPRMTAAKVKSLIAMIEPYYLADDKAWRAAGQDTYNVYQEILRLERMNTDYGDQQATKLKITYPKVVITLKQIQAEHGRLRSTNPVLDEYVVQFGG